MCPVNRQLAAAELAKCLQVSAESVVKRDEMVWQAALDNKVPICMALSGGVPAAAHGSRNLLNTCSQMSLDDYFFP